MEKRYKDRFLASVTVGSKGQIVIPKIGRNIFNIKPGDDLLVLGDKKKGIAILKADSKAAEIILKKVGL